MIVKVVKKDGTLNDFNVSKIKKAVRKSADRVMVAVSDLEMNQICDEVLKIILDKNLNQIEVSKLHYIVESILDKHNREVATSYREYRNYKSDFIGMLDEVYSKAQSIMYLGDKENSNTDSSLVATKRSLVYNELNKELYNKFFLTVEEKQACRDGFIYIHDKSARRDTFNCCLYDVETVLNGGFEMGNIWYNEPKSLDVAFDVIGDIVMVSSAQQYGGWTCSQVDKILGKYAKKSYSKYIETITDEFKRISPNLKIDSEKVKELAFEKTKRDMEQGFQGWEMKFNTVGSSRGDYPFLTITGGLCDDEFEELAWETALKVRREGQGENGKKKPVLFPKIVFLYDEELHGEGKRLEHLFNEGILTSSKTMYPDWLSLSGSGYVPSVYKEYKKVISPMG